MTSPTSSAADSCSLFGSPSQVDILTSFVDEMKLNGNESTYCSICNEKFESPKVLPCLHTFCKPCLERIQDNIDGLRCPKCEQDCVLPPLGVSGLLPDYAFMNVLESQSVEKPPLSCTGCKTKDAHAEGHCLECDNDLCTNCILAHKYMLCFEDHTVISFKNGNANGIASDKVQHCPRHEREIMRFFCRTCNVPICKECTSEHPTGLHDFGHISDVGSREVDILKEKIEKSRAKLAELKGAGKSVDHLSNCLDMGYHKSKADIEETCKFIISAVEDRKDELMKELEDLYNTKKVSLVLYSSKVQEMTENLTGVSSFTERIMKNSSLSQILAYKELLESKLNHIISFNPNVNMQPIDLEFVSNYQAIQMSVRNTFGYIRNNFEGSPAPKPLNPIARPSSVINTDYSYQNGHSFESNMISKKFGSANSLGPFTTSLSDISPYEKWSNGPENNIFQNGTESFPAIEAPLELTHKFLSVSMYPVKSQIKRQKMIYHCKFGEFGVMEGQFTEPSGVAVNAQNDIIVADTNNHRIQIFDKEGRFKFQFGECGKRDGQLLYPNRVAVVKPSGDIIVTERSPTHQIQIYNQYGQFVRKFGANILQHPRGVTVDNKGRIIVAECKVMRVIIFDQLGNVLQKFGCSKHLEFPNGVVVNDKQEIFISDNRAHCVKVFNYEGVFLRQIGGEGLTNYPIGVCINQSGEILVADNHNNFNITIFTQDGQLVNASESKVKHAQCFDVALMDDGSVVLASKDYRLYIYRYVQAPGLAAITM
ncbi:B-box type zinc finger protein ncl-1 [Araneus ventricosus]|uniref:B-box type zinc finger protein ncl-1 n=1 Tax=Araneus ventricosus TaxID=182803 RepID=A0A4Y2HFW0_ARAVE|nr:B-box type zinc finger protein ncl-1 [Araneus ventricosus]